MPSRRAFTLIELLIVIVIFSVLATLSLAGLQRVRSQTEQTRCLQHLRQWGTALVLYVGDQSGRIPRRGQGVQPLFQITRPEDWFNALPHYLGSPSYQDLVAARQMPQAHMESPFTCPAADGQQNGSPYFLSYAMNMYLSPWIRPQPHTLQEIPRPSELVFMADGPGGYSSTIPSAQPYSVPARHAGRANVVFLDGHAQSFAGSYLGVGRGNATLPDARWETETSGVNQLHMP